MPSRSSDIFSFKRFDVINATAGMRVGTDAVLLGAAAPLSHLRPGDTVADLGAGTGVVGLIIAQRTAPDITVSCIELDPAAADICRRNLSASPWADRMHTIHTDALSWRPSDPPALIISNPPYFTTGERAPDNSRALARHADTLGPLPLVDIAARALAPHGRLTMILPATDASRVEQHAVMHRLTLLSTLTVIPRPGKAPLRAILTFGRHQPGLPPPEHTTLTLRNPDNTYTTPYRTLTAPYYLHL